MEYTKISGNMRVGLDFDVQRIEVNYTSSVKSKKQEKTKEMIAVDIGMAAEANYYMLKQSKTLSLKLIVDVVWKCCF